MEVPENIHLEDHHSPPSLGESEEEYLRTTWGKLGVGKDGYLDQSQLALVCECIGMGKLTDEVWYIKKKEVYVHVLLPVKLVKSNSWYVAQVITQLFDKLDLDRDGRISFGEFLHLFQNVRPGKGEVPSESEVVNTFLLTYRLEIKSSIVFDCLFFFCSFAFLRTMNRTTGRSD